MAFQPTRPSRTLFHRHALAAAAGLCVLGPPTGHAQVPETTQLPSIVVTATRSEKPADDAPVRTEVVTREEIARTNARTLKQALENIPGLQLREVHGKSGHELSLQGLTADQVLVLVDGLPISASTGSTVDLSQYLLGNVERIEVVKGAASAQYGSAAMGGVINVITRRVDAGFAGSVSADVGSYGEQNVSGRSASVGRTQGNFRLEGGDAAWRVRLNGDVVDDKGFSVDPEGWSRVGDSIERRQLGAHASWRPAPQGELWIDGSTYRERDEQRYLYYAPPNLVPQRKPEHITRERVSAGGRFAQPGGWRGELKGLDERYDTRSEELSNGAVASTRSARMGLSQLSGQVDLPAVGRHLWQLGADARRDTLSQTSNGTAEIAGGEAERTSAELYVQDDIVFDRDLELVLGLRTQRDSDFGTHSAPKVSLRAGVIETADWKGTLRASVGQGYRVPNLKERHYLFDHSSLGYMVIGNPSLQPETSTSVQLGLTLAHGRDLSIELNGFYNRVTDLIQTDLVNYVVVDGVARYTYRNVAKARTAGLETGGTWRVAPTLSATGSFTWMQTRDLDTGLELTRRPRQQARLGLDWSPVDGTTVTVRARHQGSELVDSASGARSPAFNVLDLHLGQAFAPGWRAYLGINNVTNRQRDFSTGSDFGPIAPRFIHLGLSYDFSRTPGP